jgi:alkylation response protein AidB-like acyl-CoA dehydrogenase
VSHEVLNEDQREIRDLIRALSRERIAPRAAEIDKSAEFPWDVVELFREHDSSGSCSTRSTAAPARAR